MFSRMSSARFGKDPEESLVGPGYYELPPTLDEHGVLIPPGERWQDKQEEAGSSFPIYDECPNLSKASSRQSSAKRAKENRTPFQQHNGGKVEGAEKPPRGLTQEALEIDQLRRRLLDEEKRRNQAEARVADLAIARKSAASAHAQVQSLERKIETLQKDLEEGNAAKREAQRRVCDLDSEKGRYNKALHDKDRENASLQKHANLLKAQLEECRHKLEEEQLRKQASPIRIISTPIKGTPSPTRVTEAAVQLADQFVGSLEARFASHSDFVSSKLMVLAEENNKLHEKAILKADDYTEEIENIRRSYDEQAEELERRRSQLYDVLKCSEWQEAQLDAAILVREATVKALLSQGNDKQLALEKANETSKDLQGEIERCLSELVQLKKSYEEIQKASLEQKITHTEEVQQLLAEAAKMKGNIFTLEQAQVSGKAAREELEQQLRQNEQQAQQMTESHAADLKKKVLEVREASETQKQEFEKKLSEVLEAADKDKAKIDSQSKEAVKAAEQQIVELQTRAKEAQSRQSELSVQIERLQAEKFESLALRVELEEAVKGKDMELADKDQELSELSQELKQQEKEVAEAKSMVDRLQRQSEDLKALEKDCEEQREQNVELMESIQAYQKDLKELEIDNQALREAEAERDGNLDREMGRQAQNNGHNNHKQKIQYLKQLKEENLSLREELKKAKQTITKMDVNSRGEIVSNAVSTTRNHRSSTGGADACPEAKPVRRSSLTSQVYYPSRTGSSSAEGSNYTTEEAMRRINLKERELERVKADYHHLRSLVERAVLLDDSSSHPSGANPSVMQRLRDMTFISQHRSEAQVLKESEGEAIADAKVFMNKRLSAVALVDDASATC
eukprot:TRINITY_DN63340_c0_g1_i1.p1 TRINITY_DN63340_c0_g1~~TRINITY_DN63340_c0_g1_i1.p1  ORF type:complete len:855 (+),score=263.82 TRINITY_DN63340_c0_g1_i1:60-2624(+)